MSSPLVAEMSLSGPSNSSLADLAVILASGAVPSKVRDLA